MFSLCKCHLLTTLIKWFPLGIQRMRLHITATHKIANSSVGAKQITLYIAFFTFKYYRFNDILFVTSYYQYPLRVCAWVVCSTLSSFGCNTIRFCHSWKLSMSRKERISFFDHHFHNLLSSLLFARRYFFASHLYHALPGGLVQHTRGFRGMKKASSSTVIVWKREHFSTPLSNVNVFLIIIASNVAHLICDLV